MLQEANQAEWDEFAGHLAEIHLTKCSVCGPEIGESHIAIPSTRRSDA